MAAVRFARAAVARWVRDVRDGFWNTVDWVGF